MLSLTMDTSQKRESNYDQQKLIDLLRASFQLHLGHVTDGHWLEAFASAVDCSSAGCFRWPQGNPAHTIASIFGEHAELSSDCKNWVDQTIALSSHRQASLIESFIANTGLPINSAPDNFDNDRILIGIVDWEPACIVMLMIRDESEAAWTKLDKQHIERILAHTRDSILVHKELDRHRWIGGLARDILNSSPRGMIALSEDGTIEMANTQAELMLNQNDGISRRNNKLIFIDAATQENLKEYLSNLDTEVGADLPEMDWNMAARRQSGHTPYQIIIGSFKLQNWHVESRASDRIAMVYLLDARNTIGPSDEQLKVFYGLTSAQSKVAAALYAGNNINEAAEALHISVNTARSHVRNIYAKVGVRTQSELLGLLASGLKNYGKTKD